MRFALALLFSLFVAVPARADVGGKEWEATPAAQARELLARARSLDEAALSDERIAANLTAELPAKRVAAKAARDAANVASPDKKPALEAHAEDLEAEVLVSEAEVSARRNAAAEHRKWARELRAKAVRTAQGGTASRPATKVYDPFARTHQSDIF